MFFLRLALVEAQYACLLCKNFLLHGNCHKTLGHHLSYLRPVLFSLYQVLLHHQVKFHNSRVVSQSRLGWVQMGLRANITQSAEARAKLPSHTQPTLLMHPTQPRTTKKTLRMRAQSSSQTFSTTTHGRNTCRRLIWSMQHVYKPTPMQGWKLV